MGPEQVGGIAIGFPRSRLPVEESGGRLHLPAPPWAAILILQPGRGADRGPDSHGPDRRAGFPFDGVAMEPSHVRLVGSASLRYLLSLPRAAGPASGPWPLLCFQHGYDEGTPMRRR